MSHPRPPERTVELPSAADFGTAVPVLLIYDDDGEPIDFRAGCDIQPYLEYVGSLPLDLRSHEPPRTTPFDPLAGEASPATRAAKGRATNP